MLHWLILLTLLVHNSSAFGLYDDIDDDHLWRHGVPSVPTTATPSKGCIKDILILWDNSNSIGGGHFKDNVVPFLVNLVKSEELDVGEHGTHLGFISFSTEKRTKTELEIGSKKTAEELTTWLEGLKYRDLMGGWTFTGSAFKIANETFNLKSPLNHRRDVDDVILLVTDGEPRASKRSQMAEQRKLADDCSTALKDDKDVKIVGLAVGASRVLDKFLPYIVKWSSRDSVFTAKVDELDNVLNELLNDTCTPPGCRCNGTLLVNAYLGPGAQTTIVTWPPPSAETKNGASCKLVKPPSAKPGMRFPKDKLYIDYSFSNEEGKIKNCSVIITVNPCNCPPTERVEAKVEAGRTKVDATWLQPEPNCPTTASPGNPKTSGSFSVGNYTRTYNYTHNQTGTDSFELECHVNIVVTGELCGEKVYDPAKEDCCCGKIRAKKPGYQCCGRKYYNTLTKTCCNSQRAILVPVGRNCS